MGWLPGTRSTHSRSPTDLKMLPQNLRFTPQGGPLDGKLARAVATSVARGMAYLHSRVPPILHLDLKSPNILVDGAWRIKIAGEPWRWRCRGEV